MHVRQQMVLFSSICYDLFRPATISKQVPRKERKGEGTEPAAFIGERRVPHTDCGGVSVQCRALTRFSRPGARVSVPLACVLLLETTHPLAQGRDARGVSVSLRTRKRPPEQCEETSRRGDSSEPAVVPEQRIAKRSATSFQQARAGRLAGLAAPTPAPSFSSGPNAGGRRRRRSNRSLPPTMTSPSASRSPDCDCLLPLVRTDARGAGPRLPPRSPRLVRTGRSAEGRRASFRRVGRWVDGKRSAWVALAWTVKKAASRT